MKKKITITIISLSVFAVALLTFQIGYKTVVHTNLLSMNVEALARGENNGVKKITYVDITSYDDEGNVLISKEKICEGEGKLDC